MTEIYRIKFSKYINEQGIPCYMMYTIGKPGDVDGEFLTPEKISIEKGRVIVRFAELGIRHEFTLTPDVEIYRREKDAKEIQK
jgi:hypothetical protein